MVKSMAPRSVIFALAAGEFYLLTPNVPRFMMTAATFLTWASGRKRLSQLPYNERTAIDNG
jgi:uncharacterized protein (DUF2062 family)